MRWELANTSSGNEVYTLFKAEKKILTVTINPFSHTARVDCEKDKRVFLLRKEGLRRNKTIIRSEYGIKIGELGSENGKNFITVNEERIFYTTQNAPLAKLILYKNSPAEPLVSCGLIAEQQHPAIHFEKESKLAQTAHPGLLMALCWYMFLPVAKENVVAFAV